MGLSSTGSLVREPSNTNYFEKSISNGAPSIKVKKSGLYSVSFAVNIITPATGAVARLDVPGDSAWDEFGSGRSVQFYRPNGGRINGLLEFVTELQFDSQIPVNLAVSTAVDIVEWSLSTKLLAERV